MKRNKVERWLDAWAEPLVFVLSVLAATVWLWPVVAFMLRATEPTP